jgi:hypothetical protein
MPLYQAIPEELISIYTMSMIEKVHQHIITELEQNTKTDTIFILTSILLNLITLAINSGVASQSDKTGPKWVVFFTFIVLVIVVNIVAEVGIIKGKQTRGKLVDGLLKMYKDQGVDGYYDPSLLNNYGTRYNLFLLVVLVTGIIAIVIPVTLLQ